MKNVVITIARQYGSGGLEVGQKLAEMTGMPFYDKDLITMAAQKSGLSQAVLDAADEKAANSLLYTLAMGSASYHHGVPNLHVPLNDKLFAVQSEIIRDIAKNLKGAIIVVKTVRKMMEEKRYAKQKTNRSCSRYRLERNRLCQCTQSAKCEL